MDITLQGNPYNLQGNNQPIQGSAAATVLQPAGSPAPAPVAPTPVPIAAPAPKTTPKPAAQPAPVQSSVVFYKPDPNSPQVYNVQGQPVSYEQYIAQGGRPDFGNVVNTAVPGQAPAQTFTLGDGTYDANGNRVNQTPQGVLPVPTTPPATPPASNPNQTKIGELTKQIFSTPTPSSQKLYEDAYNASGLAGIKTKITDLNQKIADLNQKFTSKEAEINENPFLSEASRVGRVRRLTEQKNAEIGNLLDEYKQYADLYNQGVDEINNSVLRQMSDFNSQRQVSTEELNYLLGIEEVAQGRQDQAQKEAATFAEKNSITARFYKYPGNDTVYDSRTGQALSYEDYKALGGAGKPGAAFPDVQTIQSELKTISEGQSLYDPVTGQILRTIPKTYKPGDGSAAIGELTTPQFNRLNTIADNARQDGNIKDFPAVRASYETARSAAAKGNGPGDIVLMRMIAKITDPTTGVREEEFRTFESAQSTLARYGITLTKKMWAGDRLTDNGRAELLQQASDIYNQRKAAYDNSVQFFVKQADGVAPGQGSSVIPYYVAPDSSSTQSGVDLNDLF